MPFCSLCPLIFWHASFRTDEVKLMLLIGWQFLHACVQPRFHVLLMICKKRCWPLAIQFSLLRSKGTSSFSHRPSSWFNWMGPCDRCFLGWDILPEGIVGMDFFPFTDLLSLNILRQFLGPTHRFVHFFLGGLMCLYARTNNAKNS